MKRIFRRKFLKRARKFVKHRRDVLELLFVGLPGWILVGRELIPSRPTQRVRLAATVDIPVGGESTLRVDPQPVRAAGIATLTADAETTLRVG